jgi:beta-lactam-binding protein with PASTA domain
MGKIFIGYRREDSAGHTGRLFDRLSEHFGEDRVFMDVSGIEPGVDFVDAIDKAVGSSDAFIVVIGKQWLSATDADGRRRLDNPEDFIRLEIAAALRRNIRVIPVLVQGAAAPSSGNLPEDLKKLSRLHAHEISDSRWDYDVGTLIQTLEKVLKKEVTKDEEKKEDKGQPIPPPPPPKFPRWIIAIIAAIVVGIGGYVFWPSGKIGMPSVIGMPFELAKGILTQKGLEVSREEKQTNETPPGIVIDQKPKAGTEVKRGQRVELVLAVRPPIPKMPNVRGKQIGEARDILNKAGLQVSFENPIKTNERSPGTVLNQTPEPGVEVESGKKVVLEVAVKPIIPVPNVIGESFDKAKAILEAKGLEVLRIEKQTDERPPGTVVDQNPKQGKEVEKGQRVELVIASKPIVANEQQRQMARNLANEWFVAICKRQDVGALTRMASLPFLFDNEVLHGFEDIEGRYKNFLSKVASAPKDDHPRNWRVKEIKAQTVAEWKRGGYDVQRDRFFNKMEYKDSDYMTVIPLEMGSGKQGDQHLYMRNVGGQIKMAGFWM